jgi:hypothetical protein
MRFSADNRKKVEDWRVISVGGSGYACRNPKFSVCENEAQSTYKKNKTAGCAFPNPDFPAVCEENDNGSSYKKTSKKAGY